MHIRCVVFDIDGVLIDTSEMVKAGQRSVACCLGIRRSGDEEIFFEVWRNLAIVLGTSISSFFLDCVVRECRKNGLVLRDKPQLYDVFQSGYWSDVRPAPHADHLIRWLNSSNIKTGILSDGDSPSQLRKLELAGLLQLFESSSISIQDPTSKYSKPNPTKLLGLVSSLGIDIRDVAYIGDRASDILVAKLSGCVAVRLADGREHPNVNAGLRAVRGAAGNSLYLTTPDLTVDSLEDFMRWLRQPSGSGLILNTGNNSGSIPIAGEHAYRAQNIGASADELRALISGIAEMVRAVVPGAVGVNEQERLALAAANPGNLDRSVLRSFGGWAMSTVQAGATAALVTAVTAATKEMLNEAGRLAEF